MPELSDSMLGEVKSALVAQLTLADLPLVYNAVESYMGGVQRGDCEVVEATIAVVLGKFFERSKDGGSDDFVGRILEHKWASEKARRAILHVVPAYARPTPTIGVSAAVDVMKAVVNELLKAWEEATRGAALPEPTVAKLQSLKDNRDELIRFGRRIAEINAAKALHDALHELQIDSSDWLDSGGADAPNHYRLWSRIGYCRAQIQAMTKPGIPTTGMLPSEAHTVATQIDTMLSEAEAKLLQAAEPDADSAVLGYEILRKVLEVEWPKASAIVMSTWMVLPVRPLLEALKWKSGADWPRHLYELIDRLRCRLLAQQLWHAIDVTLYAIDANLDVRDALAHVSIAEKWRMVWNATCVLFEVPFLPGAREPATVAAARAVNAAISQIDRGLTGRTVVTAAQLGEDWDDLELAIQQFTAQCRVAFTAIDTALSQELTQLMALRKPLGELVDATPLY